MNRALLVGINAYPGNELNGCVNDVSDMASFLVDRCGFQESDIRLVTDGRATTKAIHDRLGWLLAGAKAGDRLVFHYSGHGAQFPLRDAKGNVTRVDECICPVDFDWSEAHAIRDKEFEALFAKIPKGARLTWVSDSCHSGDLARDLPPPRSKPRKNKVMPMPVDIGWRLRTATALGLKRLGFEHVIASLNGVLVSGCAASETSADAQIAGRFNGALTYYLLQELKAAVGLTEPLGKAVVRVRAALKRNGYAQHPQLEGAASLMTAAFLAQGK
jgi:hypothetical protein